MGQGGRRGVASRGLGLVRASFSKEDLLTQPLNFGATAMQTDAFEAFGRYTTRRHEKLAYCYKASWNIAGDRILWSARVYRGGEEKAHPRGVIRMLNGAPPNDAVRKLVENFIEYLDEARK